MYYNNWLTINNHQKIYLKTNHSKNSKIKYLATTYEWWRTIFSNGNIDIFLLLFLSFCCPSTHNLFHEKPKTSNISPPMNFLLLLWRSHQMKAISPIEKINLINYKLTKREELLFLTVLAFPKASSTGLDCRITSLIFWALFPLPETWDK